MWRKTGIDFHWEIYKESIFMYETTSCKAHPVHFSITIAENSSNPKILFSSFHNLVNSTIEMSSVAAKCEEFT